MKGLIYLSVVLSCVLYVASDDYYDTTYASDDPNHGSGVTYTSILETAPTHYVTTTNGSPVLIQSDLSASNRNFIISLLDIFQEIITLVRSRLVADAAADTTTETTTDTTTSYDIIYTTSSYLSYIDADYGYCWYYNIEADNYDSSSYYVCINGRYHRRRCQNGGTFDLATLSCAGNCIKGMKKERSDPKPMYDSKYLQCDGSSWVEKSCPASTYFYIYTSGDLCSSIYCWNGQRQPDPVDTTKYLECNGYTNTWEEKSCGEGERYDRYDVRCVKAQCTDGDTLNFYHLWDTLYMECGELKSCPNVGRFWSSIGACIASSADLQSISTDTIPPWNGDTTTAAWAYANGGDTTAYPIDRSSDSCPKYAPYYFNFNTSPYFQCHSGQWKLQYCPTGSYFYQSEVGGYCLQQEDCPYYSRKDFIHPPKELSNLVNNGSLYYQCYGSGWYLTMCPEGQTFNSNTLNCTSANDYNPGSVICDYGARKSIEYNTYGYYECDSFSWVPKSCLFSSNFNADTGYCNYNCTEGEREELVDNVFYHDGSYYLECDGYEWILNTCPKNKRFNVYKSKCTSTKPRKG